MYPVAMLTVVLAAGVAIEVWLVYRRLSAKIMLLHQIIVPWMVNISTKIPGSTPPPPAPPITG